MQISVIGFPRIGTLRELKFASEKYFKKEIEAGELLQKAQELRKTHWLTQKNAGITYISSNDFSFYDMVLDTAALLGIVPKRYKELNLSELDTYFAMARGYQGTFGDVKALAMKKWFNTNYHYIVPELEDDTEIKISGDKLWSEYAEAKSIGIETKPVTPVLPEDESEDFSASDLKEQPFDELVKNFYRKKFHVDIGEETFSLLMSIIEEN